MIVDPIQTRRALLTWMRPLRAEMTRSRHVVGELVQESDGGVRFRYFPHSDIVGAFDEGFSGYPGLPLDRPDDRRDAIKVLRRRLLPGTRPDFPDFLRTFGLNPEAKLSDLSLLAYTGARVVSDGDGFGVAETFDGFEGPFQYIFDIAAFRRYRDQALNLRHGAAVYFIPDDSNKHDKSAVKVCADDDVQVGYINRTQAPKVREWLKEGQINAKVFRINGRSQYPRLFVFADIIPNSRSDRDTLPPTPADHLFDMRSS